MQRPYLFELVYIVVSLHPKAGAIRAPMSEGFAQ